MPDTVKCESAAPGDSSNPVVAGVFLDNVKHLGRPRQLGAARQATKRLHNWSPGPREFPSQFSPQLPSGSPWKWKEDSPGPDQGSCGGPMNGVLTGTAAPTSSITVSLFKFVTQTWPTLSIGTRR